MRKPSWFITDKAFYKNLLSLALPISLQNLVTFAVNFADNVMVGTLGEVDISAVYLCRQLATVLQCFMNGIGTGLLVLCAQYYGKKNFEAIRKIVAIAFRLALGLGIVYSVSAILFARPILSLLTREQAVIEAGLPYLRITGVSFFFFCITSLFIYALRSVENAKLGMRLSFLTLFVNIIFNYVFIFGNFGAPKLGITGAAIATLIARMAETAVALVYVFRCEKVIAMRPAWLFRLRDKLLLSDLLKYGIPIFLGEMVWSFNMLYQSFIIGRYDDKIMAAFSITIMMSNLVYVWAMGLASAVGIITGKTVGEGKLDEMKRIAATVQVLFVFVGIFSGLLIFALKGPFIGLYNVSGVTKTAADTLMNVLCFVMAGTCYQMVGLSGLVKSGGDTAFVTVNDSIHVFLIIVPSAYLCYKLGAPVWATFLALKCDQILKCFVAVVKINRYKWMKKIVRD